MEKYNGVRKIIGVAIKFKDGPVLAALPPIRHQHLINAQNIGYVDPDMQGFLSSDGKFLSRTDALDIARAEGQI
jgi:hypothetical protein